MEFVNYYLCGEGNYILLIKWLKRMSMKYGICFPLTGDKCTPVINLSNPYFIIKKNGGFGVEKKIAIYENFNCITTTDLIHLDTVINSHKSVILVSNRRWNELDEETKEFLKIRKFQIIDLNFERFGNEPVKEVIERVLNKMVYPNLKFKSTKKYFPFLNTKYNELDLTRLNNELD